MKTGKTEMDIRESAENLLMACMDVKEGEQVLVLKTGQAGEAPCVAGQACGQDWNLAAGEVLIYSGSASIRIGGGGIRLTGDVLVNGKPVLTGEG